MLDRTLVAIIVYATSVLAGLTAFGEKPQKTESSATTTTIQTATTTSNPEFFTLRPQEPTYDEAEVELATQMLSPKAPPVAYWERVAECETNLDWKDKGRYAGGLGIFTQGKFRDGDMGTWERYGGEDFAKHPSGASKTEQIVVANRIAVFGYSTVVHRDPERAKIMGVPATYVWDKKPVGFTGWGCVRNTVGSPAVWAKRNSN
jgi:hypothetical protein